MRVSLKFTIVAAVVGLCVSHLTIAEHEQTEPVAFKPDMVIGGTGPDCLADADCINRFHPDIPMKRIAQQGQTLIFKTRDALDVLGTVDQQRDAEQDLDSERFMTLRSSFGTAHPMAGPVHIAGADVGDTLKVTILEINAGQYGYTFAGRSGFMSDLVDGGLEKGIAAARNYTANDYHKPSDEVRDDWDWSGIEQDLDIFTNFIDDLANSGEYPNWYEGNEFKALRDATRD